MSRLVGGMSSLRGGMSWPGEGRGEERTPSSTNGAAIHEGGIETIAGTSLAAESAVGYAAVDEGWRLVDTGDSWHSSVLRSAARPRLRRDLTALTVIPSNRAVLRVDSSCRSHSSRAARVAGFN